MLKLVRIRVSDGKVVDVDRECRVTKNPDNDGPDEVMWIPTHGISDDGLVTGSPAKFTVYFATASPFGTAPMSIPIGSKHKVTGDPDTYKYDVYDRQGRRTDDPNVIIQS